MSRASAGWVKRHPLVTYFVLTYAITSVMTAPLIATAQGWLRSPVPLTIHYLVAFAPMLAALVTTAWVGGRLGLRDLLGRAAKWRIGLGWLLVAIGSPIALFALGAAIARMLDGAWPDFGRLGEVNFLGNIGLWALLLWLATYGFGEEIGWRGFALPRLQRRRSALSATLILGVLWLAWHLPAFFYLPTFMALGWSGVPGIGLGVILGAIVYTWLYNSTGGSVFAVAVAHGLFDFFIASGASAGTPAAVMSTAFIIWAIAVVIVTGPATLSRAGKQVIDDEAGPESALVEATPRRPISIPHAA